MIQYKSLLATYTFKKPELLSESEFEAYQQSFATDNSFSLIPKNRFWNEFGTIKWKLLISLVFLLIPFLEQVSSFMPAEVILVLYLGLLAGTIESMLKFTKLMRVENRYYERLKHLIISSHSYSEFTHQADRL